MRALLTLPLAAVWTLALGTPAALCGAVDRTGRVSYRLARAWGRLLLRTWGVRVDVRGSEHVPEGPAVFAVNHGSALDIPIVFGHLPAEFRIIHKRSLYWLPVVGQYLLLGGHIGIHRGRPFEARRSLQRAAQRIGGGTSVAVFPEGTRSPDAAVRPFKRGSFVLAIQAGVPVVPVSLAGVKRIAPRGLFRLRPGGVTMTVHPALATAGSTPEDAPRLAREAQEVIARTVEEEDAPPRASAGRAP